MKNNPNYNDGLYRNIVKRFFKEKFDVQLIDTPDSYFKIKFQNGMEDYRSFIPGKYNFDLIPIDYFQSLTFVEVETVRDNNSIFNPLKKSFNVLASKYWKYCTCSSRPGKFVYVQIDNKANPTGKLAIIDSIDIFRNCNLQNYKVLPSEVNYTGKCAVYEIPKLNFIEYYNINEEASEREPKVSNLIKVSDEIRIKFWNKFQNYSINDNYLKNCEVLRFQGYKNEYPFEEDNCEYFVENNNIRKHIFKLTQFKGFSLIAVENVKNIGKKINK